MTKPGGDPAVAALAHELMVTNNRVDGLTDIVGEVAAGLQSLTTQSAGGKGPPWWPDLKDSDKAVAWRILVDWLRGTLLPHQPEIAAALRPCWYRHAGVIDELTALYATWHAAYRAEKASPATASEWLDRWVPGARRRIGSALDECKREHTEAKTALPGDGPELAAFANK